ncbi:LPS translocon maturation chaperone LptM [Candidatus Doolittlea endobia]|uniref:LPS translocon maturation chaperone LptM n=1 Tax=Candidatus Doolittlea endobia TaxID=1778262 RepID=UPI0038B7D93D
MIHRTVLGLMLVGLYGCGLKAPLYFPPTDTVDKKEQRCQLTTTLSSFVQTRLSRG